MASIYICMYAERDGMRGRYRERDGTVKYTIDCVHVDTHIHTFIAEKKRQCKKKNEWKKIVVVCGLGKWSELEASSIHFVFECMPSRARRWKEMAEIVIRPLCIHTYLPYFIYLLYRMYGAITKSNYCSFLPLQLSVIGLILIFPRRLFFVLFFILFFCSFILAWFCCLTSYCVFFFILIFSFWFR